MDTSVEYVSIENQPQDIQEVFKTYFEGSLGLYEDNTGTIKHGYITKDRVKLLTEGQIRKFIEDNIDKKIKEKIDICYGCTLSSKLAVEDTYNISIKSNHGKTIKRYFNLGIDLLQALWKVALEIIKEEIEVKV